jgi:hypothetical protein
MAEEPVQIHQVTEPILHGAIVEEMSRRMQDQVFRTGEPHPLPSGQLPAFLAQQQGIRGPRAGFREKVVMDVDGCTAPGVAHGRDLMHPAPVIALVVGVAMGSDPAIQL